MISVSKEIDGNKSTKTYPDFNALQDNLWYDVTWSSAEAEDIKKGMSVELAGFPGEKEGWPYTHTGEIVDVTKTDLGGYLIWYNADTTPGNSGSCVMITDANYVRSNRSSSTCKKIVVG